MKYLTIVLFVIIISCKTQNEQTTSKTSPIDELSGAWRMTDFMQITDEGDTIEDDRVQYKMYVDGSVMWGFEAPEKYTEWFGYGTYYIDGDTLYETMSSGSWAFRQAISDDNLFKIGIDVEESFYTQIIVEEGKTTYETYERIVN